MGCLEKILGTLLGLFFAGSGVYFLVDGTSAYSIADCIFMIANGALWIVMNFGTNYEDFESDFWQIFQSPVTTLIGKWIILAIISTLVTYIGVGLIMGFDSFEFWAIAS